MVRYEEVRVLTCRPLKGPAPELGCVHLEGCHLAEVCSSQVTASLSTSTSGQVQGVYTTDSRKSVDVPPLYPNYHRTSSKTVDVT